MTTELQDIVEKSYQIFKKYKATAPLDVCTECCMTKNQESELVSLSIRHVPFDLLYKYNTAAKTEKPDIQEFKHFLPRFLELTAELQFLHHNAELVLSRFEYYDKGEWAKEEQELLQEFAQAYFLKCLMVYPLPGLEKIDSILIMLWKTKINIDTLLAAWINVTNNKSILHFNDLINRGFQYNKPDELSSAFADKELSKKLVQWLDHDETKEKFAELIENLILDPPADVDDRTLSELSWPMKK